MKQQVSHPMIQGMSASFLVAAILAFVALLLSFFIKPKRPAEADGEKSANAVNAKREAVSES